MLSKKIFILVFINKNNLEFSCKTAIFEVGDDRKACFRQVGQKEQKKKNVCHSHEQHTLQVYYFEQDFTN